MYEHDVKSFKKNEIYHNAWFRDLFHEQMIKIVNVHVIKKISVSFSKKKIKTIYIKK